MFPIAIQLYSLRDDCTRDFSATLDAVAAMGYQGVEFAGLYGHSASEIAALVKAKNLIPVSAHVDLALMTENPDRVFEDYATIGCPYMAVPWLGEDRRPGTPGFEKTLEDITAMGKKAKEHGIVLMYHNHAFEFNKIDGVYGLDLMYQRIPADILKAQLDTCWVNYGGEEPCAYVRKYTGRVPVLHLKDFVSANHAPFRKEGCSLRPEEGDFAYRPIGFGAQNIPALLKAAGDAGSSWLVVEQDSPSLGKSPLECAKISIDYLRTVNL